MLRAVNASAEVKISPNHKHNSVRRKREHVKEKEEEELVVPKANTIVYPWAETENNANNTSWKMKCVLWTQGKNYLFLHWTLTNDGPFWRYIFGKPNNGAPFQVWMHRRNGGKCAFLPSAVVFALHLSPWATSQLSHYLQIHFPDNFHCNPEEVLRGWERLQGLFRGNQKQSVSASDRELRGRKMTDLLSSHESDLLLPGDRNNQKREREARQQQIGKEAGCGYELPRHQIQSEHSTSPHTPSRSYLYWSKT
jgi:hypothetical protein